MEVTYTYSNNLENGEMGKEVVVSGVSIQMLKSLKVILELKS